MVDSARYLEYASNLRDGFYIDPHNIWYLTYTLFIYSISWITSSESELYIVIGQYLIHFISLIFLYKSSFTLFKSRSTAFICIVLYLLFYEITLWNSYILCESIYISLTCISLYYLTQIHLNTIRKSTFIVAVIIILLTILTKPTGVALFGSISVMVLINYWYKISNPYLKYALIFTLTILVFVAVNRMLATFYVIENYEMGEVIFALSTLHYRPEFNYLILEVPNNLDLLDNSYPPVFQIAYFVIFNLKYWIALLFTKLFFFLLHIRPFWSVSHNSYNLLILLPTYYYAIRYLFSYTKLKSIKIFALFFMCAHSMIAGITWVDWDGRFFMPIIPVLVLLASSDMSKDVQKLSSKLKSTFAVKQK